MTEQSRGVWHHSAIPQVSSSYAAKRHEANSIYTNNERLCAVSYIESQVVDSTSLVASLVQIFDDQAPIRGSHRSRPILTPCDNQKLPAIACYQDSHVWDRNAAPMVWLVTFGIVFKLSLVSIALLLVSYLSLWPDVLRPRDGTALYLPRLVLLSVRASWLSL